jgi:rhodanese-related sulfurtransferase
MSEVPEVDVQELAEALEAGAPLIDVREPDEYAEVRARGATLIPLGEVPARSGEVPADRTVYVICRSGRRSASAVEHWRAQGFDAVNVAGGTLAWVEAGLPVETGSGASG